MKITESQLRSIIKQELDKILNEADDLLSFEDWLEKQNINLKKLMPADKKIVQDRYDNYKKNKTSPQTKKYESDSIEGIARLRSGT